MASEHQGQPHRFADVFQMVRVNNAGRRIAVCEAWTHPGGIELKLTMDGGLGLQTFAICRTRDEVDLVAGRWADLLREKGWS